MAGKAIKVTMLKGDLICFTSRPWLPPVWVSIQLQESCLTLSKECTVQTTKSTNSGFSVSLFCPAPELRTSINQGDASTFSKY